MLLRKISVKVHKEHASNNLKESLRETDNDNEIKIAIMPHPKIVITKSTLFL
jgi:hypothetical protein